MEKWERLEALLGEEQVELLKKQKIAIVGCGGVGGYVIEALARSNVSSFILIDYDVVQRSNCNRQIIALENTIGKEKVTLFKKRILEINPMCNVVCYQQKLTEENIETLIADDVTYAVDACDDLKAKEVFISYCFKKKIPFITALGTGKRMDPSKLMITTLDKTMGDPLARHLRQRIKEKKVQKKVRVCFSEELPKKKKKETVISSAIFVPASAGLLIASFLVQDILKRGKDDGKNICR